MTATLVVALDVPTLRDARALAASVGDACGAFKVGMELWSAAGPDGVRALEAPVFLDLKLHDIPTTVSRAAAALAPLGAAYLTVHALGGRAMLEAANEGRGDQRTLVVTVLTHHDDRSLREIGLPPAREAVPMLARLALDAGCDGVVCAPADLAVVRTVCPRPFLVATPGVRPLGAERDEQARTLTPREATRGGADLLVVGRPISRAPDPRAAALAILEEMR
ncbi:MAG: orotidine-5'-phosphate decarboxylase [Acidobacteria bacterium]|nr:orotidine-5'-phosphate decarboxylase [Acidobacteriota bacterium]